MDLIIRNATIVTDGMSVRADLGVRGGRVAALGDLTGVRRASEVDATDCVVLPGAVDLGLNLLDGGPGDPECAEGYFFATRAAVAGGVTTTVMTLEVDAHEDMAESVAAQMGADAARAMADFAFHLLTLPHTPLSHVEAAVAAGVSCFWLHRDDDPATALRRVLPCLPAHALVMAMAGGDAAARILELSAIARGGAASVLLGDLATVEALRLMASARDRSHGRLHGAARLAHLLYDKDHGLKKLRLIPAPGTAADRTALAVAAEHGLLSAVLSGHKPRTHEELAEPEPPAGIPTLSHFIPMLLEQGLSPRAISRVAAAEPARLAGLYPRKGSLLPGSDADMVIVARGPGNATAKAGTQGGSCFDPLASFVLSSELRSVYRRGTLVMERGEFQVQGGGAFVARPG